MQVGLTVKFVGEFEILSLASNLLIKSIAMILEHYFSLPLLPFDSER